MKKLSSFYEAQTGLHAGRGQNRLVRIKAFLEKNNLSLSDIKLENHIDYLWNKRRNRTENEKKSEVIGSTNSKYKGYCLSMWWVVPIDKRDFDSIYNQDSEGYLWNCLVEDFNVDIASTNCLGNTFLGACIHSVSEVVNGKELYNEQEAIDYFEKNYFDKCK